MPKPPSSPAISPPPLPAWWKPLSLRWNCSLSIPPGAAPGASRAPASWWSPILRTSPPTACAATLSKSSASSMAPASGRRSSDGLRHPACTVTDTYQYDAFGRLIASTGTTSNNFQYSGEQFDGNLGLQLLPHLRHVPDCTWLRQRQPHRQLAAPPHLDLSLGRPPPPRISVPHSGPPFLPNVSGSEVLTRTLTEFGPRAATLLAQISTKGGTCS